MCVCVSACVCVLRYSLNAIWSLLVLKWSWHCARPKEQKQKGNKRGSGGGLEGVGMQTVGGERGGGRGEHINKLFSKFGVSQLPSGCDSQWRS